jgi:hypothetical protein
VKPNYWLVDELVERLAAVVPPNFLVFASASGERVEISATDPPVFGYGGDVKDIAEQVNGDYESNVALAAASAMSQAQSYICDVLDTAWPPQSSGLRIEPGHSSPTPGAAVRDGRIHLWFGDERQPALVLEPIPLRARSDSPLTH